MIVIEKREARFDSLLNFVSRQSGVVFSFSTKKIAADKILTLTPGKRTLEVFLEQLKSNTGLDYKIVGTHIIFLERQPVHDAKAKSRESTVGRREVFNNDSREKSSSRIGQTRKNNATYTKEKPGDSEPKNRRLVIESAGNLPRERVDTSRLIQKNDTPVYKESIPIDSVVINRNNNSVTTKIETIDSVMIDTVALNRQVEDRGAISPGNLSRISRANVERIESKVIWFIGAQISRITGFENRNETFRATGFGGGIKMENSFSKKFSLTAGLGFDNFSGKYTYSRFTSSPGDTTLGSPKDTTIDNFAIAPLMFGLKYYYKRKFYLSAEIGLALKGSSATRTKLALSPSLGVLLPTGSYNSIDLSLRFTHIVAGFGIPESNGLEKGGYGFLSLGAAYGFGGRRFGKRP